MTRPRFPLRSRRQLPATGSALAAGALPAARGEGGKHGGDPAGSGRGGQRGPRGFQALQPADLKATPTWRQLPAIEAGRVVPWPSGLRFSCAGFAPHAEALVTAPKDAKKVA